MISLDSYSRQVFNYMDPILIYISLWIDCLFEIRKISMFSLAFVAGSLQGHWWGFISRNYLVCMTHLLSYECFHRSKRNSFFIFIMSISWMVGGNAVFLHLKCPFVRHNMKIGTAYVRASLYVETFEGRKGTGAETSQDKMRDGGKNGLLGLTDVLDDERRNICMSDL